MHYDAEDIHFDPVEDTGWDLAVLDLEVGDSAWDPASTKRVIWGPARVTYERSPNQIVATVENPA